MIYVPMLKTRQTEMQVAKDLQDCFTDRIIPLFEILEDSHQVRYKVDPDTKEYIYVKRGKQRRRLKEEPIDNDIITLQKINESIGQKIAFIDYFRYTTKKYGNKINVERVILSRRLNDDLNAYKNRLLKVSQYNNFIPVVSIKDGFEMGKIELRNFLIDLKKISRKIAFRVTEEYVEQYKGILEEVLEITDFFLFDIEEQSPQVKFIELEEISEMDINAKIILLNSPRKAKITNGTYPDNGYTELIDNCASEEVENYSLNGYGDYCGLKDTLPSNGGSNGLGSALALIYDYNENAFLAYTNKNTSEGMGGYNKLIPIILNDRNKLDPQNTCEGYNKIDSLNKSGSSGNWSTWHNICARRYISQVYKNL